MKAQSLIDQFWNGHLPVDVAQVGESLVAAFHISEGETLITVEPIKGGHQISVRAPSAMAQRYACAHALARVVQGAVPLDGLVLTSQAFSTDNFNIDTFNANAFALELLLPARMVTYAIQNGHQSLQSLSALFGVSEVAVNRRLEQLGIL